MPFQIDGRGDMNAFVLTSPLAGVMLLTRRQPFYPSAAHDKFFSICTAFGGYTEFGIVPAVTEECLLSAMALNLKRMVKAILLFLYKPRMWVENIVFSHISFLSTGPFLIVKPSMPASPCPLRSIRLRSAVPVACRKEVLSPAGKRSWSRCRRSW